jgi:hypothetical protein
MKTALFFHLAQNTSVVQCTAHQRFLHTLKFRCAFVAGRDHNSAPYNIREPSWGFNLVNLLTKQKRHIQNIFFGSLVSCGRRLGTYPCTTELLWFNHIVQICMCSRGKSTLDRCLVIAATFFILVFYFERSSGPLF